MTCIGFLFTSLASENEIRMKFELISIKELVNQNYAYVTETVKPPSIRAAQTALLVSFDRDFMIRNAGEFEFLRLLVEYLHSTQPIC